MGSALRQRVAKFAPLVIVVAAATFLFGRSDRPASATIEVVAGEYAGGVGAIELELRRPGDDEVLGTYRGTPTGRAVLARWPLTVTGGAYRVTVELTRSTPASAGRRLTVVRAVELADGGIARVDVRDALAAPADPPSSRPSEP